MTRQRIPRSAAVSQAREARGRRRRRTGQPLAELPSADPSPGAGADQPSTTESLAGDGPALGRPAGPAGEPGKTAGVMPAQASVQPPKKPRKAAAADEPAESLEPANPVLIDGPLTSTEPTAFAQAWFAARGYAPFAFQREVWQAMVDGESGLLHATTGAGKTLAVWLGAISAALASDGHPQAVPSMPALVDRLADADASKVPKPDASRRKVSRRAAAVGEPLTVLWLTPMRALAADSARAIAEPLPALRAATGRNWTVGIRSGDTGAAERTRQNDRLPTVLVTTPESLSLMLTRADSPALFEHLRWVIVDEWHELIGNKRGVQVQLAISRLKTLRVTAARLIAAPLSTMQALQQQTSGAAEVATTPQSDAMPPSLGVWGMSATLGNLELAAQVLTGAGQPARLVRGRIDKTLTIDTLIPPEPGRFPWGGHLGLQMLQPVIDEIDGAASTLVFTNTRSQSELWYQAILDARPEWAGLIALHHGSLDKEVRGWVESGLKQGALKAVVCTSSLDLGVDFLPVERVLQVGSPKGIARLLQRAGRSGHAPGRPSRVTVVPTHALELLEGAAVRAAVKAGRIESRYAPQRPLDVLVQHLVTVALGTGFTAEPMYDEVRQAWSYRDLSRDEFQWALDFVVRGGASLQAYPEYRRVLQDEHGVYRVPDAGIARRHRMSIGTIVSDAAMLVKWTSGGTLGTIEESFIARLRTGDNFLFAGRMLELVRVHEMAAYVRRATKRRGAIPRWGGGKFPMSTELADAMLAQFTKPHAVADAQAEPELRALAPLLDLQTRWSQLPRPDVLLAETLQSREGCHLFLYPFAGRSVHIGLSQLLAWRAARDTPRTFSISVNDYGLELLCADPIAWDALMLRGLMHGGGEHGRGSDRSHDGEEVRTKGQTDQLFADILASLNSGELAQRRFREIARVSGLVFQGYPGAPKSTKQLQASSSLFYEVFRKYDPANALLGQADREVLEQELELGRLREALQRLRALPLQVVPLKRPTPLAFPLLVERLREQLSTEKLSDRIERMVRDLEAAAG